jgi:hypothetical protein
LVVIIAIVVVVTVILIKKNTRTPTIATTVKTTKIPMTKETSSTRKGG